MYLLDTNICVYLISGKYEQVNQRFLSIAADQIAVSVIVAAELAYGVEHSQRVAENRKRLDVFFSGVPILDWGKESIWHFAKLKSQLRNAGTPIGELDLQIASHALALDAVCVTNNTREFERIEGLRLENWV
jgi:tRNA(fMet)-specific endonuclease VapC